MCYLVRRNRSVFSFALRGSMSLDPQGGRRWVFGGGADCAGGMVATGGATIVDRRTEACKRRKTNWNIYKLVLL